MKKILFCLVVFGLTFSGCSGDDPASFEVSAETDITYSKGNGNAKVIITEYSEYECDFCATFTLQVLPKLQDDYISEGKVQFIFKDYPTPNQEYSQKAAEATYCAGEQDENLFWQMHVDLYSNQEHLTREDLSKMAEGYGINVQAFNNCLDTNRYRNLVLRNRNEGKKKGVNATPTIFINDTKLIGVQPYENIKKVLEAELLK